MTPRDHPSGTPGLARMRHVPGLDGLRALAVVSVLLYHARYGWIRGGFLGVEVFFVISGYLITSLLLSERLRTGRIDLRHFYGRRARRLLPALFLTLLGVALVAVLLTPDEVATLRGDLVASLLYGTNWFFVMAQKSYFEVTARPSLVQHLWSLAVEEQFYLVWPVLFALGMRVLRRKGLLIACLVGAVCSAGLMALLYHPGTDPSRVYYGTDTRASALLLGAALALVWSPWRLRRQVGRGAPLVLDAVGLLALAGLVQALLATDEFADSLYRGGFLRVSVLTVLVIAVTAHPAAHLGRLLDLPPLRWVGLRSYGLYLYHWPVYQLTRPQLDVPLDGLPLFGVRMVLTVGLAELSYRYVEMPVRQGAVGRWWRTRRRGVVALARDPWPRVAVGALVVTALVTMAVVRAQPPEVPDYLLAGGSTAAGALPPGPGLPPGPAASGATPAAVTPGGAGTDVAASATTTTTTATLVGAPGAPGTAPGSTVASLPPGLDPSGLEDSGVPAALEPATVPTTAPPPTTPVPARRVNAIGDSVMLGAAGALQSGLPGTVFVDARVGRQVSEGIGILRSWRDLGLLGDVVVVHLGNNGTFTDAQFDELRDVLSGVPKVVFLTCRVPRQWEASVNQTITSGVARMPNAVLVDWYSASADHPELFWSDGMHLRPEGATFYAQQIAAVLG